MKAKAALLLEANMNSEMFPAFLRGKKVVTFTFSNRYELASPLPIEIEQNGPYYYNGNTTKSISLRFF